MRRTMKILVALSVAVALSGHVHAATDTELKPGMVNPGYEEKPDWFKVSFLDLYEDIEEAADDGKRVMLYFYQEG